MTTAVLPRSGATLSPRTGRWLLTLAPVALLVVLVVVFALVDGRIATLTNLRNVTMQAAPIALLALGAHVVLVSAGIDLSAGYAVGLAGVVLAGQLDGGTPLVVAALLGLLAVGALGVVNGALVGFARLPAFIATLGTMTIAQGLTLFAAPDGLVLVDDPILTFLGHGGLLGIPMPVVTVAVVAVALWWLMRRTRFGLRTYAYGSDAQASLLAGVRRGRQLFGVYVIAAVLVFCSMMMVVAQVPLVQPNIGGITLLLDAIAAAVIGGTSIFGGRGTVGGVLVGALIIALVTNGLQVFGVNPSAIDLFKGLIILAALVMDAGMRVVHRHATGGAR